MNEAAAIASKSLQSLKYLATHKPGQTVQPGNCRKLPGIRGESAFDLDSFQYESRISLELLQELVFPFASCRGRQYPYCQASPMDPPFSDDCLFL
ncbi:hypothetical protein [Bradyrhizobium septentrionale]|uniref:Uncharacterized protein n=1 Tax=Bradyrhizobium septentrionale TaxID=1404411 RepID=A0A973W6S5_9BRAD|nr:hypothetical protein [Bradyrhizobium septentrionale]UGY17088.1 hypothetical protein HAP48_0006530 [Bradyrhizobium septentrionale]UGY25832.1 hypothetical protein HU675_0003260 [Bradyrhizobium septentrionale]